MTVIHEFLIRQCGEAFKTSRETYDLEIPSDEGKIDALYDPYNSRLKIYGVTGLKFRIITADPLIEDICNASEAFTKLIIYAYPGNEEIWRRLGFSLEGTILGFYGGTENAVIWASYLDYERAQIPLQDEHIKTMNLAKGKNTVEPSLKRGYECEIADEGDATELSKFLKCILPDYPTPLDSKHISSLISEGKNIFRYICNSRREIVVVASAEIDHERKNAELTDCATHESERGKGFMGYILSELEKDVLERYGLTAIYSLTRAGEQGINNTFAKLGYIYTGRLFNNCRMPDGWESMNIWCARPDGKSD